MKRLLPCLLLLLAVTVGLHAADTKTTSAPAVTPGAKLNLEPLTADEVGEIRLVQLDINNANAAVDAAEQQKQRALNALNNALGAIYKRRGLKIGDAVVCDGPPAPNNEDQSCADVEPRRLALRPNIAPKPKSPAEVKPAEQPKAK